MDWRRINFALDYVTSTGNCFSTEQRLAIQAGLTVLQQENHFQQIHFLGKILGADNDYWIVCGFGDDFLKDRTFFYSKQVGTEWIMLPQVSDEMVEQGLACRGHFTGDPANDCDTEICPEGDETTDDEWVTIKEEERLSATVIGIMNEAAVVPRGALLKNANGLVFENKMFEGLNKQEASQLHSYYHLRRPENPWDRNIVVRADYNLSLDFMDSIACDIPVGCWSIIIDPTEQLAVTRSLYWPGFFGWHQLGTQNYGWVYLGPGKKNWDVPFMILPVPAGDKIDVVEETGDIQDEPKADPDGGDVDVDNLSQGQYEY